MKLKEEGLELPLLGFAIRLKRIIEENGKTEDQIEPIILDFAAYCLRRGISFEKLIQSGHEVLYLEQKFGIFVEKISDYIIQGKQTIDRLEEQRQEILSQKQSAREERDTIVADLEKYGKEIPLIDRIKQLERDLDETKRSEESHNKYCGRLLSDILMVDTQNVEYSRAWSQCEEELEKLKDRYFQCKDHRKALAEKDGQQGLRYRYGGG